MIPQDLREELARDMDITGVGFQCVKLGACPSEVVLWPDSRRHEYVDRFMSAKWLRIKRA